MDEINKKPNKEHRETKKRAKPKRAVKTLDFESIVNSETGEREFASKNKKLYKLLRLGCVSINQSGLEHSKRYEKYQELLETAREI